VRKVNELVVAAFCILSLGILASSPATTSHGDGCACPERSSGWVAYPDSARGAPDFFKKSSIQVREIVLCDRGVHFLFRAKQAGKARESCLVVGEPTLEESLNRLPVDSVPSDADVEQIVQRLDWDRGVFRERMKALRSVLRQEASGNCNVSFKTGWFRDAPRIYPGAPIRLRWEGQAVDLLGIPNVYFRSRQRS